MWEWRNGASRLAMGVVVAALFAPMAAEAASFTVTTGTTDTAAKTLTTTDTGTVQSGATLAVTGVAITTSGVSSAPGTTINNAGTITATGRGIDLTGAATPRNITLNNFTGALISTVDDAFRLNTSIGNGTVAINNSGTIVSSTGRVFSFANNTSPTGTVLINNDSTGILRALVGDVIRPGSGTTVITNSGLIDSTASANRAINMNVADLATVASFQVINKSGGIIQSLDDAIRITGTAGTTTTSGTFVIDNAGTIQTLGTGSGQAIDWRDLNSANATVRIINRATGIISAADNDAIRPGLNTVIENYGQIIAYGVTYSTSVGGVRPSADAIDFGARSGTVYNYAGGLISGAKNGTASDLGGDITVYNYAGATIIGRNGAGVGSGGNATIFNYGTITGAIDGVSTRSDGDGIDVDFRADIVNYGLIQGTGARGYDSGNRLNNSEGIAFGGGTVQNYGMISGAGAGIVANNDSNTDNTRSGVAATTITNYASGTIVGQSSYAIRFENKTGTSADNDTIVNYGTIIGNGVIPNPNGVVLLGDGTVDPANGTLNGVTYGAGSARFIRGDGSAIQMGEGNDVLTNYGTIIGNTGRAVNMEGGNDTVNIMKGSRIVGLVDGGAGTNTLNYNKVGLGEANRAALMAGQTVNIGGTLYTSFQVVNANAPSFSALAGAGAAGIANLFDNLPLNATGLGVVDMLDKVASSGDVSAALSQLTPSSYQSLGRIGMNNVQQTTSLVGQHLTQNRINGLGTDVSGLGNALAMFDGGMFDRSFGGDRALAAVMAFPGSAGSSLAEAGWGAGVADAMAYAPINKAPALRPIAVTADHGFFVTSGASFAREGARADAPGFKANTVNVLAGYDQRLSDSIVAGVFGGYAFTRGNTDGNGSNARISTGTIGGYGTYQAPTWFATLMGLYGFSDYTTSRVALGSFNDAKFSGDHYAIRGTVGTDIRVSGWVVTPEIGLQYMRVMTDGFTERGGAAALIVGSDSAESLRSSVGARFAYDYAYNGGVLTPELRLAWLHEFSDGIRGINASFADTTLPGSFVTATASGIRDRGVLGAGLSGKLAPLTVLSVNYDAIIGGSDAVTHQVMGRIKHAF